MKKIFLLLALNLVVFHSLMAQNSPSIQETEYIPNCPVMLANLNTSQITSVVFIDKVTTFANIINYNTTEKNFSNGEHFKQALSELYRASDETRFIRLNELKNRTATKQQPIILGLYDQLKIY